MQDSVPKDDACSVGGHAEPSLAHLTEAELAARLVAAPHSAILSTELCARYTHRVRICSRHHLHSSTLADDVSRHVLAVLVRKLRSGALRKPEQIGSVVLALTRVAVQDIVCTGPTGRPLKAMLPNHGPGPEERGAGYRELLVDSLERLGDSERDVLIGTYLGE